MLFLIADWDTFDIEDEALLDMVSRFALAAVLYHCDMMDTLRLMQRYKTAAVILNVFWTINLIKSIIPDQPDNSKNTAVSLIITPAKLLNIHCHYCQLNLINSKS